MKSVLRQPLTPGERETIRARRRQQQARTARMLSVSPSAFQEALVRGDRNGVARCLAAGAWTPEGAMEAVGKTQHLSVAVARLLFHALRSYPDTASRFHDWAVRHAVRRSERRLLAAALREATPAPSDFWPAQALANGSLRLTDFLLARGVRLPEGALDGAVLDLASRGRGAWACALLAAHPRCRLVARDANGWSALHHAVRHDDGGLVGLLLAWGSSVRLAAGDSRHSGCTPIHMAALYAQRFGMHSIPMQLRSAGASWDDRNAITGRTARAMLAARLGNEAARTAADDLQTAVARAPAAARRRL